MVENDSLAPVSEVGEVMIQDFNQNISLPNEIALGPTSESDRPRSFYDAHWIDSVDQLEELSKPWQRLTEQAIHKNLFMHPAFFLPAFKHLQHEDVKVLAIDAPRVARPDGPRVLCAMIPLVKKRFYHLPLTCLETWSHDQSFDNTPLVRRDCAESVLKFVFKVLARKKISLLSFDTITANGELHEVLTKILDTQGRTVFNRDRFERACLVPSESSDSYLKENSSKKVLKNARRMERRLGESGELSLITSNENSDLDALAVQFLDLEAAGWKGREGTALRSNQDTREFFQEMVARHRAGTQQIVFHSLLLNDHPVAMICDLYAGQVGFSYKTTFDEEYSSFSPGLLAELKNIEFMHRAGVKYMDSCTSPDNEMINRLWGQRLEFQSLVIALQGQIPKFATLAMPLLQSTHSRMKQLFNKQR